MNIADLNVEEELIPLFDNNLNSHARITLQSIFSVILTNLEEISERQNIIRGMLANLDNIAPFPYLNADLEESKAFTDSIIEGHANLRPSKKKLQLQKFLGTKTYMEIRSKVIQFANILHRVHLAYFQKIDLTVFPDSFRSLVVDGKGLFEYLRVPYLHRKIVMDQVSAGDVYSLLHLLGEDNIKIAITGFWKNLFLFEAFLSISKSVLRFKFCFPEFANKGLAILDFYHPVLKSPVKNTICESRNVIVLTGPNMSGKSTLLRSISICVFFAHLGLAVPAKECTMPLFSHISIGINKTDNLSTGYSHFFSEIVNLKNVLINAKTGSCFAVFDEFLNGTNLEDALELSIKTIRGLRKYTSSIFIISTYLHQLKEVEEALEKNVGFHYLDC